MKYFYIIRHGETEFNKSKKLQGRGIDASLNEKGKEQAKAIAEALINKPITKIITSSLKRTKESAAPLIDAIQPEVEGYSDLDEMSFGDFEGSSFYEVQEYLKYLQKEWSLGNTDIVVPGGESPNEVYERAANRLIKIAENSPDNHIAVFIHGRLIRILLAGILGLGLQHMQDIKHENGAINILKWESGVFSSVSLNETSHLKHLKDIA